MRFYWPIAKADAEQRMVWGYASTEAEDDQGETVTRRALAAALDDYMRFANIREMHQPSAVGVATEAAIDDKGLYLGARIVDADAWQKVVAGVYKGFSIGGRVRARDAADRRQITALQLTEISLVDRPANPEAVFDCWKRSGVAATDEGRAPPASGPAEAADGPGETAGWLDHADPGYQPDGRPRYPIDSERHIRAAWAFVHQPGNAARYTPAQLGHIKQRIIAAWRERIDPAGPPAAPLQYGRPIETARKGLAEAGALAAIVGDLEGVQARLAAAAITADGLPLAPLLDNIIDELRQLAASLAAADGEDWADCTVPGALAAMALAGGIRKSGMAPLADGLAKLAGEILPRLDALQQRVEQIARTPLPPQTVARSIVGIAKAADGGGAAIAAEEVVAALARMSDEERTLTLIKAAHANPIIPLGQQPGSSR